MAELYPYPRFSLAERDRRWEAVRELMRAQYLDVIVTPQNTGHSMDFQANSRYLTHVGGGGDADIAAVFPLEGDVTAIATSAVPRWTPGCRIGLADVREARRDYGKQIVERIRELGREAAHRHHRPGRDRRHALARGTDHPRHLAAHPRRVPDGELVDATDILARCAISRARRRSPASPRRCRSSRRATRPKSRRRARRHRLGGLGGDSIRLLKQRLRSADPLQLDLRSQVVRTLTRPTFRRARARRSHHQRVRGLLDRLSGARRAAGLRRRAEPVQPGANQDTARGFQSRGGDRSPA